MKKYKISTLDLKFHGTHNAIGVFLLQHASGNALVECGPGSTLPGLIRSLAAVNLTPADISDVFITHIHLDHAGSAGWWASQGAVIHVHHVGAPHLIHPEKLLASARRVYGERMDQLWGEFLPVPEEKLKAHRDEDIINLGGLTLRALDTPGHADHHMSYIMDKTCFSGDVGGVRLQGIKAVRLPTVPPEFHLEKWRKSLEKFQKEPIKVFATTHFGLHEDAGWHLDALFQLLEDLEIWMETVMPFNPSKEEVRVLYMDWIREQADSVGLDPAMIGAYDIAISSQMSADGIYRYWHKYRQGDL